MLASEREGPATWSLGGYVDLHTGEVFDEALTDPAMVGEDSAVDVSEDPDRWLWFDRTGSGDGRRDVAAQDRALGRARSVLAGAGIRVG